MDIHDIDNNGAYYGRKKGIKNIFKECHEKCHEKRKINKEYAPVIAMLKENIKIYPELKWLPHVLKNLESKREKELKELNERYR